VQVELYINENADGKAWSKVTELRDDGKWVDTAGANSDGTPRRPVGEPIHEGLPSCLIRNDGVAPRGASYTKWSIVEVESVQGP